MTVRSLLKRAGAVTAASTALVLAGATSASAHHCFVPLYSLNGPTSANWFVVDAETVASFGDDNGEGGFVTGCDEARDAGYAALEDAGLPVAIKIFEKMSPAPRPSTATCRGTEQTHRSEGATPGRRGWLLRSCLQACAGPVSGPACSDARP